MKFCENCGGQINEGVKFCSGCGRPVPEMNAAPAPNQAPAMSAESLMAAPNNEQAPGAPQNDINSSPVQPHEGHQTPPGYQATDNTKTMSVLAYIIFFIPLLTGDHKKSPVVRFHTNQGTVLALCAIGYGILFNILTSVIKISAPCVSALGYSFGTCKVTPWWVTTPLSIISLGFVVLMILGIINAAGGKQKELPVIGKITIIK